MGEVLQLLAWRAPSCVHLQYLHECGGEGREERGNDIPDVRLYDITSTSTVCVMIVMLLFSFRPDGKPPGLLVKIGLGMLYVCLCKFVTKQTDITLWDEDMIEFQELAARAASPSWSGATPVSTTTTP